MSEYEVACLGKRRFTTRRYAKAAASRIRRTGGPAFRTYGCEFCGLFHVGHRAGHATYRRHNPELTQ